MTTKSRAESWTEVQACADQAGLGALRIRREDGSSGRAGVVFGTMFAVAGVALLLLSVAGFADEIARIVGMAGVLIAGLLITGSRRLSRSMRAFLAIIGVAILIGGSSFVIVATSEDDSVLSLLYIGILAVMLIAGGVLLAGRGRQASAHPQVESVSVFENGVIYAGPGVGDWMPVPFRWDDTTLEEQVTSVSTEGGVTRLIHHITFRRRDGWWVTPAFNPIRRTDRKILRALRTVMWERQADPLVDQIRAGGTVAVGGVLQANREGLSRSGDAPASGGDGTLAWGDVRVLDFEDGSLVVRGKRRRAITVPLKDARDPSVLQMVIDRMTL